MTRDAAAAARRQRWTAALVLVGTTLVSVQGGLLRVAYPVIRTDLRASIVAMEVVGIAGLVMTVATVVAFGRLAARPLLNHRDAQHARLEGTVTIVPSAGRRPAWSGRNRT